MSLGYPVTAEDLDGRPSITWSNDTDYEEDSFDDDEDEEDDVRPASSAAEGTQEAL